MPPGGTESSPFIRVPGQGEAISPEDLRQTIDYVADHRTKACPYNVMTFGVTHAADDTGSVGDFAEVGASWRLEGVWTWRRDLEYTRDRIRGGRPRI